VEVCEYQSDKQRLHTVYVCHGLWGWTLSSGRQGLCMAIWVQLKVHGWGLGLHTCIVYMLYDHSVTQKHHCKLQLVTLYECYVFALQQKCQLWRKKRHTSGITVINCHTVVNTIMIKYKNAT